MIKKKITKKKIVKKIAKKPLKIKKVKVKVKVINDNFFNKIKEKPIGKITHYFGNIKVGIIKLKKPIKIGDEIRIKGVTTNYKQKITSMQFNYKEIKITPINKEIGIKVSKKVREGDLIYK